MLIVVTYVGANGTEKIYQNSVGCSKVTRNCVVFTALPYMICLEKFASPS